MESRAVGFVTGGSVNFQRARLKTILCGVSRFGFSRGGAAAASRECTRVRRARPATHHHHRPSPPAVHA
eukprot:4015298-Prymnesium_polylepis.2